MVPLTLLILLLSSLLPFGQASPATPVPETLPASECQLTPRTVAAINEIVSTTGTPVPLMSVDDPIPYQRPDGTPAGAETISAVTSTVRQFIACGNEGDILRLLAVFSDDFLRNHAGEMGLPITEDTSQLITVPEPATGVSILSVDDVVDVSDGSVSALVILQISETYKSQTASLQFTFINDPDAGRWLIDEIRVVTIPDSMTTWTPVRGEGYEGVIVPEERVHELTDFYIGEPIEGAWTPTADDIAALERNLPSYEQTVESTIRGISGDFIQLLPTYKRQYAGFIQGDRKKILVNASCEGDDLNWRTQPLIVMDGSDCFFRVVYDPAAGSYSNFEINGVA
jgi:hypothetical protein